MVLKMAQAIRGITVCALSGAKGLVIKVVISCSTTNFTKEKYKDVFSAISEAKALGFRVIDLMMFENRARIDPYPSDIRERGTGYADKINRYLKQNNMTIYSINANFFADIGVADEEIYADVYDDFIALLWFAELLGVKHITLQPGKESSKESREITLHRLKMRLFEMSDVASKKEISIAVEAHIGSLIEKVHEIEVFMQEMYPRVSLTFDSSHQIMQGYKTEELLDLLKFTSHCHLRDANLGHMQANLRDGETDFYLIIAELKRLDYQGVICIEYCMGFDKDFANLKQLKTLLERET